MSFFKRGIAAGFAVFCLTATANAQVADPANGFFVTEGYCDYCNGGSNFTWNFHYTDEFGGNSWYQYLYQGTGATIYNYFGSGYLTTGAGLQFYPYISAQSQWHLDYGDEGFSTDVMPWMDDGWGDPEPLLEWSRWAYIPTSGGDFARMIDRWTNNEASTQTVTLSMSGTPGNSNDGGVSSLEIVSTSDGDTALETSDAWVVFDDSNPDAGAPFGAIVWQGDGADQQADSVTLSLDWGGSFNVSFNNVAMAAGETVSIGVFAVQASTQGEAEDAAAELSAMNGAASDYLDVGQIEDSLANFIPGSPTGPRLRSNGPYRCDEGTSVPLAVTITDADGAGTVTYSWDFNNDGVFGDSPNIPNPTIDCSALDGPSLLRVGIQMQDDEGEVDDRHVSISVTNIAPVVSSTPPTSATTDTLYSYQIVATDYVGDTLDYTVDEGPQGMTVSNAGLVRWTPAANGIGPQVPVTIIVSDGDGGEYEQTWLIDMGGGPVVVPGGPYRVAEGDDILLSPQVTDPEGDEVTFAWDLDGNGVFDDSSEATATWSAAGIDGPQDGFAVRLIVSDGTYDVEATIPIQVQNAPPLFVSVPSAFATVDRLWTYTVQCVDPGDDTFEISVDEEDLPAGMTFDAATSTLSWTPNAGALVTGDPAGHYQFRVTAEDDDRNRGTQEVSITVGSNSAPPVPAIKYPDGTETVRTAQPTIILENVDDPDGDEVQYFLEADYNPCFCSPEHQTSGALPEGLLVTQWTLPRPFNVDVANGGNTQFYIRRWSSDGLAESAKELSLYNYEAPEPDGDDGGDGDADADGDGGDDGDDSAGCACRTTGERGAPSGLVFALAALGMALVRRRRR